MQEASKSPCCLTGRRGTSYPSHLQVETADLLSNNLQSALAFGHFLPTQVLRAPGKVFGTCLTTPLPSPVQFIASVRHHPPTAKVFQEEAGVGGGSSSNQNRPLVAAMGHQGVAAALWGRFLCLYRRIVLLSFPRACRECQLSVCGRCPVGRQHPWLTAACSCCDSSGSG